MNWKGSLREYLRANEYDRDDARRMIMRLRCGPVVLGGGAAPIFRVKLAA